MFKFNFAYHYHIYCKFNFINSNLLKSIQLYEKKNFIKAIFYILVLFKVCGTLHWEVFSIVLSCEIKLVNHKDSVCRRKLCDFKLREHVKINAFLAGQFAKALFFKPANSDKENGFLKKKFP